MQVKELQQKHGLNRLTPPKEKPEIIKFLLQFTNPLMALLLVAGGLTFMAYGLQVGVVHGSAGTIFGCCCSNSRASSPAGALPHFVLKLRRCACIDIVALLADAQGQEQRNLGSGPDHCSDAHLHHELYAGALSQQRHG
jgi:hypothetical protein